MIYSGRDYAIGHSSPLPLISVIIPSYNHRAYVGDAIASAAAQVATSYRLELIVIDDGSTDGSDELLKTMQAEKGPEFILHVKRNEGLCRTLNGGVREFATGEYVAILASDDMWRPEKLERQLACLLDHPDCQLCYSNAESFGENRTRPRRYRVQHAGDVRHRLTLYNFIPAGSMLFTRKLFDAIGGFDETDLTLEDWDFLLRASAVTHFCYVDESLLLYREHGESAISQMKKNGLLYREKKKVLNKNRCILNPLAVVASTALHFTLDSVLRPALGSRRRGPT